MRILVATDQWFPDRMGGVARVATDLARGCACRGHDVFVLAPRHEGMAVATTEGQLTVLRELPRGRLPQTLTDPGATRRAASRLAEHGFDVMVAHSCTVASGLMGAGIQAPLVYVFHASVASEARYLRARLRPGREWLSAALLERPLRRLTLKAVQRATSVLVLSEYSRGILRGVSARAARDAVQVPGAVDTSVFSAEGRMEARARLGISPSIRLVLAVRRVEPRMGLENLIEAVQRLDDMPELQVAIAGSGDTRDLERQRRGLGLEDRIGLLGRVPDEELPLWYRAADLCVVPTLAYEGFGLVTAEALASGTPVVGTPVGATPELLLPLDGRLVSRGTDAPSLADAVRTGLLLSTPEFRDRCRAYALDRFSWAAALPAWERALDDAIGQHRSTSGASAGVELRPAPGG